jgi:hypothetical protein
MTPDPVNVYGQRNSGLTVSGMNEPPSRYDFTMTVDRDGGTLPSPADFAVIAERAI